MSTPESKEEMEVSTVKEETQQQQSPAAEEASPDAADGVEAVDAVGAGAKQRKSTGGAKGKVKKEEVMEVDPNYEGQRFHIGELIYANYADGKQWFEAKVLKVEKRANLIYYYLHYQGWSDKYNDWRPYHKDAELMTHDEEGKRVFDEAKIKLKEAKPKAGKNATAAAVEGTRTLDTTRIWHSPPPPFCRMLILSLLASSAAFLSLPPLSFRAFLQEEGQAQARR